MGKKKGFQIPEESGELDMSPMIDMVFLLLIFFIVNATAITVKKDMSVRMPTASNAGDIKSANGCIVVNVYGGPSGGTFGPNVFWGTDEPKPLKTEQELQEYVTKKAKEFEAYKTDPGLSLYLRGDKEAIYKNTKTAIKVAGTAGVANIMFATVPSN